VQGYILIFMDSLKDILENKNLDEPTEVTSLRAFIKSEYNLDPTIKIQRDVITVYMPNASLATTLRMRYRELQTRCQLTRKLYIRIG